MWTVRGEPEPSYGICHNQKYVPTMRLELSVLRVQAVVVSPWQ